MALTRIDGPRVPAAAGGRPDSPVVLVHGYGADGNDLIELAPHWGRMLPGTAFVAPHAPEPCEQSPMGRQWFGIMRAGPNWMTGARRAAPILEAFVEGERQRLGLTPDRVALVGFSQGTVMSLQVALRQEEPYAAVVGFSGALAEPETVAAETTSRPPVLLVHGDQDPMIPVGAVHAATAALARAGVSVQFHICQGLGHSIDQDGLHLAGQFLRDAFRGALDGAGGAFSTAG
ncbi:alpha/beta hydrolase [Zavarzinia sp. CC-PAN008]|uniref:alpha/beta hydrolase n=1 Tax=Zavarzinia sp. CC-PAN008 TaxID=3243332 RepID=UPI003F74ABE1